MYCVQPRTVPPPYVISPGVDGAVLGGEARGTAGAGRGGGGGGGGRPTGGVGLHSRGAHGDAGTQKGVFTLSFQHVSLTLT